MSDKKVFSIHLPGKQVYVDSTYLPLEEKLEIIKNDKDHRLYSMLQIYPNSEIREEEGSSKKEVVEKYYKDCYKILNVNILPPSFSFLQSLYKWKIW